MLLKRITLNNIRSYANQAIEFSEGSTLLAGDIGCGKSSLLLAIEFALFGTSRPDLPAEALLRKGETQGSVELCFSLADQEINIKRNLKKDKNAIKQVSGHIVINGIKKELTAVELKAEIIHLLGYPEEFIEKNKNYIFRFTVYTPQEEMKFILHEEPEIRLEVIRKIFNLEKYCLVRENIQPVLKSMRVSLAISKTKLEPMEDKKAAIQQLEQTMKELQEKISKLLQPMQEIQEQLTLKKNNLERLEILQRERQKWLLEQARLSALIEEKTKFLVRLTENRDSLARQLEELGAVEGEEETINRQIKAWEEQEKTRIAVISQLQERSAQLRQSIENSQAEIKLLEQKLSQRELAAQQISKTQEAISAKTGIAEELNLLELSLEKCRASIVKNKTIIAASEQTKTQILQLDNCPTCLQKVSSEHKQKIYRKEDQVIEDARRPLQHLERQKHDLMKETGRAKQQLLEIQKEEQLMMKLRAELRQLEEAVLIHNRKRDQLKQWARENNETSQELQITSQKPSLREKIILLQESKLKLSQLKMLEKNKQELQEQLMALQELICSSEQKLLSVNENLQLRTDLQEQITSERSRYLALTDQEREYSLKLMELKTTMVGLEKNKEQSEAELALLKTIESEQKRLQDNYNWLELYFIPLTSAIEKQVMFQIYNNFNEIFKEWFAILINNEQITARLDDSFTPVIEQNGYEISFSNLSGGEKTAASLAYRLSLNRVINDVISRIKTKDLLILDEPTDGFSSEQLDRIREVLEKLQLRQTIIVSHESKIESFVEKVIRISKDGMESLVLEA